MYYLPLFTIDTLVSTYKNFPYMLRVSSYAHVISLNYLPIFLILIVKTINFGHIFLFLLLVYLPLICIFNYWLLSILIAWFAFEHLVDLRYFSMSVVALLGVFVSRSVDAYQ